MSIALVTGIKKNRVVRNCKISKRIERYVFTLEREFNKNLFWWDQILVVQPGYTCTQNEKIYFKYQLWRHLLGRVVKFFEEFHLMWKGPLGKKKCQITILSCWTFLHQESWIENLFFIKHFQTGTKDYWCINSY